MRWDAVSDEEGKPSVTGYEVGYRERPDPFDAPGEDSDEWAGIQKTSNRLETSVTITGLLNGQAYLVSVRTLVDGGMSEWSSPVLGIPVIPAAGPVFPGGGCGGGTSQPPQPPQPPPPTPQVYNDNVFVLPVTENLAALWTSSKSPPLEDYTARFYEHFNDEFDFLFFYPNLDLDGLEPGSINGAFYSRVKNDVQGIGLETFSHNNSWGSAGKLQGVIFHNYDDPSSFRGLLLHELMHRWGNFVVPITSYPYGPHWGLSTSGGYLDCYNISNMIDHGDGKFSAPDPFYFRSSEQYSPHRAVSGGLHTLRRKSPISRLRRMESGCLTNREIPSRMTKGIGCLRRVGSIRIQLRTSSPSMDRAFPATCKLRRIFARQLFCWLASATLRPERDLNG